MISEKEAFTIADICHSAHVTRWHSRNCYRYPSIAEHAFLVTMIASRLYYLVEIKPNPKEELALLKMAMWHDMPEVITGDLPTPIKRWLERYFKEEENPIDALEEALCHEYKAAKKVLYALGEYLYVIFKMADVAEAYRFIHTEGKGSQGKSIAMERKATLNRMRDRLEFLMAERLKKRYEALPEAEKDIQIVSATRYFEKGLDQFFWELDSEEIKELDFVDEIQKVSKASPRGAWNT